MCAAQLLQECGGLFEGTGCQENPGFQNHWGRVVRGKLLSILSQGIGSSEAICLNVKFAQFAENRSVTTQRFIGKFEILLCPSPISRSAQGLA
jgi:hypothetical protein